MNVTTLQNVHFEAQRSHVAAAFTLVLVLMGLYMYFVSASVVHVVIRQEVQQEINRLNSEISQLEAAYIEVQHSVSAEIASLDGYQETQAKIFIDRIDDTLVLSASADR